MNITFQQTSSGLRAYLDGNLIGEFTNEEEARHDLTIIISKHLKKVIAKEWPQYWWLMREGKKLTKYHDYFLALKNANEGNKLQPQGPPFYVKSNKEL